jgi:tetratricopeptide (TPR) repeat protein
MTRPQSKDDNSQMTVPGCLLMLLSLAVLSVVAVYLVTWRHPVSGAPLSRWVSIIVPLLAAALCYGGGTAILKFLGVAVDVEQKEEFPNRSEEIEAPARGIQIQDEQQGGTPPPLPKATMEHQIACTCGNVLSLSEDMAGSTVTCSCGRAVLVPSSSEQPAQAIMKDLPPPVPDLQLAEDTPPKRQLSIGIVSPKQALLRIERGTESRRRAAVMVALTADAVWIQETWGLREVPLRGLVIEMRSSGTVVTLTLGSEPAAEKLTLTFPSAGQAERWYGEAREKQRQLGPDSSLLDRKPPEGVALVQEAPPVPREVLGRVEFTGSSQWEADRGLQLRAGILGADAVVDVYRHKVPGVSGSRHATGLAIRVEDADARNRLRMKWYAEEVCALVNRLLLLLVLQGVLLFWVGFRSPGKSNLDSPTGETPEQMLTSAWLGVGLVFAWPLIVVILLWLFRWPQLLRAAGLATLAATAGRGLMVWLAHFLAVLTTGTTLAESKLWILFDPVDWCFVIFGVVLCLRAWRLADDARQILPEDLQTVPVGRKTCSRGLAGITAVYALGLLWLAGTHRYQASAHLLQPGVDSRREHEALLALNEGAAQANRGDLVSAEQSFQRSLQLWEKLAPGPSAPAEYRASLARTLYNLGWLRQKQGRNDEAEPFYSRAVALADELPQEDTEFKEFMASARHTLADLRDRKELKQLVDKDKKAAGIYEEAQKAQVQDQKEKAQSFYQEAITLWEEVYALSNSEEYRTFAAARLAAACHTLGELQQQLGNRQAAEAALKKAIEWEKKR